MTHSTTDRWDFDDSNAQDQRPPREQAGGELVSTSALEQAWLVVELDRLEERMDSLMARVEQGDDEGTAEWLEERLQDCHRALRSLVSFARSHTVEEGNYLERVVAIERALEAIRAKAMRRHGVSWQKVLRLASLGLFAATSLVDFFQALGADTGPVPARAL